MPDSEIKEL